jgi:hypothetical protein
VYSNVSLNFLTSHRSLLRVSHLGCHSLHHPTDPQRTESFTCAWLCGVAWHELQHTMSSKRQPQLMMGNRKCSRVGCFRAGESTSSQEKRSSVILRFRFSDTPRSGYDGHWRDDWITDYTSCDSYLGLRGFSAEYRTPIFSKVIVFWWRVHNLILGTLIIRSTHKCILSCMHLPTVCSTTKVCAHCHDDFTATTGMGLQEG